MKEVKIMTLIKECSYDELDDKDRELVDSAKSAAITAYAPYSGFRVGAAVRMADDTIETGTNQENVAYPAGICAERNAVFHACSVKPGMPVKKIAIAAWTSNGKPEGLPVGDYFQDKPISPCGICRQALLEYEAKSGNIEVILYGREKIYILPSVSSLLPLSFVEF